MTKDLAPLFGPEGIIITGVSIMRLQIGGTS